ncbi:AI-2E family transporter [Nocardia otitidiscaviarum]|uniref:AI-2E family transporter n=1 Tax=Nocardia otitidiscaviarum TaxID=1823 RepID=A0A516NJU2_9NOCA|nr:AI-2E family transporter [Nocardia otitidiscaviarum]MCP9620561.1 AI-2E family transporter [Nocardia otitidiscaviarum]QDP79174.1 AI-2E family transporter [Nocardia otitidiscaviarum]
MSGSRATAPRKGRASQHPWSIPRGLIVLLATAAAVISIAGVKAFAGIVGPTFLALMLTVAVAPIQAWVRRRGWPAWLGMGLALLAAYAIVLGLLFVLILSAARLATELPSYSANFDDLMDGIRSMLHGLGVGGDQIQDMLSGLSFQQLVTLLDTALSGLAGVLSNLAFVLALLLFMAFDAMSMDRRVAIVSRMRPDIAYALSSFAAGTRRYLVVSTVFGLIVAVFDGVALWWLGVPLPLLWALLSFITNFIPNIGFVIGLVPPALLALLEGGPSLMLWVILLYCVINFVIQSVIQPKYVGDAVGLSVTITFLSLIVWAWVLGALGALLAIPLTLLLKAVLLDIDPSTRWVSALISTAPQRDSSPE